MSLSLYKKKRSFGRTPEPKGSKASSKGQLRFVVQQHHATNLHYDFRLEMEGVLKSWAVPKGPSMNPEDKRLAMMVEDHPFDYKDFEGIIPEGNYGAGTVIVWDEGTYTPAENDAAPINKTMLQQLRKGSLKIILHGQKLKGAFALVHTKSRGENAWLLIKKNDEHASGTDITKKDKSVTSGLSLQQVARQKDPAIYGNNGKAPAKGRTAKKKAAGAAKKKTAVKKSRAVKKKSRLI